MNRLQTLLDKIPEPLEPLDISMLDGYLCGVLLQPHRGARGRLDASMCWTSTAAR